MSRYTSDSGVLRAALVATPFFWAALCLSLSAHLLHWRVVHEPGASPDPLLAAARVVLLAVGGAGSLTAQVLLLAGRDLRRQLWSWILCGITTALYLPILFLTLLLLV